MDIWNEIRVLIEQAPEHLQELDADGAMDLMPYDRVLGHYKDVPVSVKRINAAYRQIREEIRSAETAHKYSDSHRIKDDACAAFHGEVGWMIFKASLIKSLFLGEIASCVGLSPGRDECWIKKGGEIVTTSGEEMAAYFKAMRDLPLEKIPQS